MVLSIACIGSLISWFALHSVIEKDFLPSAKSDQDFIEDLSPFISYHEPDEIEKDKDRQDSQHHRESPKSK